MGFFDGLTKALGIAGEQITHTSPRPQGIHFTNNFQAKAKEWHLSEKDALDVYYHGSPIKENMRVRRYNGYEIGIFYFMNNLSGQPIITSIWKRDRR